MCACVLVCCFHVPGQLDVQRVLYNMHRRNVPLKVLHEKAEAYITEALIDRGQAINMIRAIEAERGCLAVISDNVDQTDAGSQSLANDLPLTRLSLDEMRGLLQKRERQMQDGGDPSGETDQWRVYRHIT